MAGACRMASGKDLAEWPLKHDWLLTNYSKRKMGLGQPLCPYCVNLEETSLHALRDCSLVMPMWLNMVSIDRR